MRLFIAEKPSVANAIAAELGVIKKHRGYTECKNNTCVTHCFGHMLELAAPDFYLPDDIPKNKNGTKKWRVEDLPILPAEFALLEKKDSADQLAVINKLIKKAATVVNAGDIDREGQNLVDELLQKANYRGEVLRYWASAITPAAINSAIANLEPNEKYFPMGEAARARSIADWLIGMNASRAYTLRTDRGGTPMLVAIGRVQTPVLNLIAQRDRNIETFAPKDFFNLLVNAELDGLAISASWKPKNDQAGLDEEGRLIDVGTAEELASSIGTSAVVTKAETSPKTQAHPQCWALGALTTEASKQYGMTAQQVLDTAQALYETHKITTYPRSDCGYLPVDQHAFAADILAALNTCEHFQKHIAKTDPKRKSATFNDKKVTAHHGIVPTGTKPELAKLNLLERQLFDLICLRYIAQFLPAHHYDQTKLELDVGGEIFECKGNIVTELGWKATGERGSKETLLPALTVGQAIGVDVQLTTAKTKAPSRFTEGSIMQAMENIDKFVPDSAHKKLLREGDGIGTPATRANILVQLKARGYIETVGTGKKEYLQSSASGRAVVDMLPEQLKSPTLTALLERQFKKIETGELSVDAFLLQQADMIKKIVTAANSGAVTVRGLTKGKR